MGWGGGGFDDHYLISAIVFEVIAKTAQSWCLSVSGIRRIV
jgi:hypothetical protein